MCQCRRFSCAFISIEDGVEGWINWRAATFAAENGGIWPTRVIAPAFV